MNLAICDDEKTCIEQLERHLIKFRGEYGKRVEWNVFESADELIEYYRINNNEVIDVLITDIEMDGMNGIELANTLRGIDNGMVIIFLSSHDEYVKQCFEPMPLTFWDKPVSYDTLRNDLERAAQRIKESNSTFSIKLKGGKQYVRIPFKDIIYFKTCGKAIAAHTAKNNYEFIGSFKEYDNLWKKVGFIKASRYEYVNPDYIRAFSAAESCLLLIGGETIAVSRNNIKAVKMQLFEMDLIQNKRSLARNNASDMEED